jgi:membrane-associated PAP2 superfamily phosphatase
MPKSWWIRGYLLGFALYLSYRLATATFWSHDLWAYLLFGEVVKAVIWPIILPFDLVGIRYPLGWLSQHKYIR